MYVHLALLTCAFVAYS